MKVQPIGANHFVIETKDGYYLQSYKSIVAFRGEGQTILFPKWDYSKTTAKHVGQWLGLSAKEIREYLKEGRFSYNPHEPAL